DLRPAAADQPGAPETPSASDQLTGRRRPSRIRPASLLESETQLKGEAAPVDGPPDDVKVAVPRRTTPRPQGPVELTDEVARPRIPLKPPARVGTPSAQPVEVAPRFDPQADRLPRRLAGTGRIARVNDPVAPRATLLLRQKEVRQRSLKLYGGTKASEAAV